ncbi:MAG TPA: protein-disulfide reductase DsbD domain-containing protein [Acetobacteraceae bacterium]|nr:protein-disulfide reductase DsbD domain-containing protein [Acetobacteraceae bacterium]
MRRLLPLFLLCLLLVPWPAAALETAPASNSRDSVALVSDTDAIAPGKPFRIGLDIRLAPGWHTYWRNPGDAGVTPSLALTLPPGVSAGPIAWPAPRRIAEGPVMTYAYTGDVLLPVTVTPLATAGPLAVQAHARWLVCQQICVPEEATFRLDLPPGTPAPSAQAPLFAAHDRAVPRPSPWQAQITSDGSLWVHGPELRPATVTDAWFIPDHAGEIDDDAAQPLSVRQDGFVLSLKLAKDAKPDAGLSGILAVRDRSGLETDVVLNAVRGPAPPPAFPPLQRVLIFAFLGGLILNLMPCVFPVLAMKAVALAQGAARGEARTHAAFYTAGVLVTFAGLAGALLAARAAGAAAGWGFQFASPVFVAAMAWLLFGVGLNLSGVFEIGGSLTGTGSALASRSGHLGSFFTGLLAVLVATPCTAPFMGVAIAAGLAAPPAETLLVFLVMGLGLAAPYAAFSSVPALARLAPRPGHWMGVLKQGLAFPLYGAAAWLLWVVSQETGPAGVLGTAAGFVLLGFAAWVVGVTQFASSRARRMGQSTAVAAMLLAGAVLSGVAVAPGAPAAADTGASAEAFSPARLAALRAAGRPVFVNMTAAWCVTCLVNERVAIASAPVRQAFATNHVAYLKGDWTRQDPAISNFLRQYGRDGVPLYVYYPPHEGKPVVLPQILTQNEVLRQLTSG